MGLESHIESMGFYCGIYKELGPLTTTASFCGVVLPSFLSKPNVCGNGHYLLHFGAFWCSVWPSLFIVFKINFLFSEICLSPWHIFVF